MKQKKDNKDWIEKALGKPKKTYDVIMLERRWKTYRVEAESKEDAIIVAQSDEIGPLIEPNDCEVYEVCEVEEV